ncbi:MAG: hypothetical protein RID09_02585 [Coleofasciculus sp. G1-WW12-02]
MLRLYIGAGLVTDGCRVVVLETLLIDNMRLPCQPIEPARLT